MSRAYRISASETVQRRLDIKDGFQVNLEILPVLPAQRMIELLSSLLEERGFECTGTIATRIEDDGVKIVIDMENSTIEITLADVTEIEISHKIDKVVEEEVMDEEKIKLKLRLDREIDANIEKKHEQARRELTEKLKGCLGDIQAEMDQVINATIGMALKEKAAQLGDIEEIIETGDGSISIRINV